MTFEYSKKIIKLELTTKSIFFSLIKYGEKCASSNYQFQNTYYCKLTFPNNFVFCDIIKRCSLLLSRDFLEGILYLFFPFSPVMTSLIRQIGSLAVRTFKREPQISASNFTSQYEQLYNILNTIKAEDINLDPSLLQDRGTFNVRGNFCRFSLFYFSLSWFCFFQYWRVITYFTLFPREHAQIFMLLG